MRRCARIAADSRLSRPACRIANSSPPRRATVSVSRTQARRRSVTALRRPSPTGWPSVSLTLLKWSRSRQSTASVSPRATRTSAFSISSRKSTRFGGDVAADAAVAEEGAVGGKARLAADLEPAHAAVAMAVGIDEVPERPARQEIVDMGLPERPVGGVRGDVEAALADLAIGLDAGDLGKTTREIGEAQIRVHLPEPVGRDLGEIFEQTFERHPGAPS